MDDVGNPTRGNQGGNDPSRHRTDLTWTGTTADWHSSQEVRWEGAAVPARAPSWWRAYRLNIVLFVLTVASTVLVGGPWYGVAVIAILLAHEMGHYLACRRYGVPATLPYFVPMPLTLFGTMGAVIKMQGRIPNRRVLFDIAVAGPLAGLVVALPAVVAGLHLSTVTALPEHDTGLLRLGDSLLFVLLTHLVKGPMAEGMDVVLHPLAFAGWAGLFVTGLNLLPVGQLDGGHIVYGIFGWRSKWISLVVLIVFTFICIFYFPGWVLLIALILLFGFRHPAPVDDRSPLGRSRLVVGLAMLLFFVLSFPPVPLKL